MRKLVLIVVCALALTSLYGCEESGSSKSVSEPLSGVEKAEYVSVFKSMMATDGAGRQFDAEVFLTDEDLEFETDSLAAPDDLKKIIKTRCTAQGIGPGNSPDSHPNSEKGFRLVGEDCPLDFMSSSQVSFVGNSDKKRGRGSARTHFKVLDDRLRPLTDLIEFSGRGPMWITVENKNRTQVQRIQATLSGKAISQTWGELNFTLRARAQLYFKEIEGQLRLQKSNLMMTYATRLAERPGATLNMVSQNEGGTSSLTYLLNGELLSAEDLGLPSPKLPVPRPSN